jgi:hypothetical protein
VVNMPIFVAVVEKQKIKNQLAEPFWLLFGALIVLTAFSFVPTQFMLGGVETKRVHFFSELTPTGQLSKANCIQPVLNKKSKAQRKAFLSEAIDSLAISEYGNDSLGGLIHFFQALQQLQSGKRKTVRIAYFGDSMIEGDLITQDLREMFQDTFGGVGVGFMPVTSIVAGFRQTVIHSFSKNWNDQTMLKANKEQAVGISGHTFIPVWSGMVVDSTNAEAQTASWVKYTAVKRKHLDQFYTVRLFYGKAEGNQFVSFNQRNIALDGLQTVNALTLNSGSPIQSVYAGFSGNSPLDVYGFSLDSDSGVFVDNFSFRGNSGLPLTRMSQSVLSGLNRELGYDLIILQYGVNVVNSKLKDYAWYKKGMTDVVTHLQRSFPGTSILLISAGDKGYRKEGRITTDPAIPYLVESQRATAEQTGAGFWNLYEAMGGYESMAKWTSGDTLYANKDYTHFNHRGARRVGRMLYTELIREFTRYQKSSS